MKFKVIFLILIFIFIPSKVLATEKYEKSEKTLRVTCSLFPVYEFAREIAGGHAEVNLLLKPGVEPHEFDPSPSDIKTLNDSDVFIFMDENMEHWAEKISESLGGVKIIRASQGIELTDGDPHVWLDLRNAQIMVKHIAAGLIEECPEKAEIFNRNADDYCEKLAELDEKFMSLNKNKTLVFAGKFAFNYFIERYKFNYISAYDGENEPSIKSMAAVLKFIKGNDVKFILSDSPENPVTRRVAEEAGAEILIFDSCENVSEFNKNLSFYEIMRKNYDAIEKASNK